LAQDLAFKAPRVTQAPGIRAMPSFELEVEYAKSGRAACKQCKGKIDKDAVRIGVKAAVEAPAAGDEDTPASRNHALEGVRWHHFGCLQRVHGPAWFKKHAPESAESLTGFQALRPEDREAVAVLLKACRGEGPSPEAAPAPAAAEPSSMPTGARGGKRKGKEEGDSVAERVAKVARPSPPAAAVLTEEQTAAVAAAKERLASKNVAALGAMLAKNGLPKAGRKEELMERVAECQALGVPPQCSVCEKVKLKWSRETGKFSCPGFFDQEAGAFKRCKGPEKGTEIQRTPWQELM